MESGGSGFEITESDTPDLSGLASVVQVERNEDIAAICGRIDTAPTFAVVVSAPRGNRSLSTELGMRRLARHGEESGKVVAVATHSPSLASRARQVGIPTARRPEHVRWDSGGRTVVRVGSRSFLAPAIGRYMGGVVLLVLLVLALGAVALLVPSATVVAYPPATSVSKVVSLTASEERDDVDFAALKVPATRVTAERTVTLAMKTTGQAPVGTQPAKVTLTINNPTESEVILAAGTAAVSPRDGLAFELDADTPVPAGGVISVAATARLPGTASNLAPGTITTWEDPQHQALPVTNAGVAAGGLSEPRPAVDASDIVAIRTLATDLERSETFRQLITEARPHDAVFLQTAQTTIDMGEPSAPAGTPADVLTLDVTVTVTALAVPADTLDQVARRVLREERGAGELIPGSVTAREIGARQVNNEDGSIRTALEVRGDFARDLTAEQVKDAVKGKSAERARSTLAERYSMQDAEVHQTPGWAPRLPWFAFRISVDIRSRPPETEGDTTDATASPAPSTTPTPGP
jgi:hypothetical protein